MAILVAGSLIIKEGYRDAFVASSTEAVALARASDECLDFAVSPDPLDGTRVNIFEKWVSRQALENFREGGQESDMFSLINAFDVSEYDVP